MFPPFLKEFHSVWKAQEERDELAARLQDREAEISSLLLMSGDQKEGASKLLAEHKERLFRSSMEADMKLLARVEQLRDAISRKLQAGDVKDATSILGEVGRLQEKVKELEILKLEQSDMILRLEKKLASLLKRDRRNSVDDMPRSAEEPRCSSSSGTRCLELEALEIAKDAWRTERQVLESARDQLEQELLTTKKELKETKDELDAVMRRLTKLTSDLDRAKDELAYSKNRISFFEKAEIERQLSVNVCEKQLREQEKLVTELETLQKAQARELEELNNRLNDAGRTIIAQDTELENASKENQQLAQDLNRAQEQLMAATVEIHRLEQDVNNSVQQLKAYEHKFIELEHERESLLAEISRHEEAARATDSSENELREVSTAYKELTATARDLEHQLMKVSSEKQAYRQALLEAREQWRLCREEFASVQARYRSLLSEYESRLSNQEATPLPEPVTSMPPSLKQGSRQDTEENLKQLREFCETLQKELVVFRKSRNAAIEQRQMAMEKLKKSEAIRLDLESKLRSLKSATELLHKRLKNYIRRCELLETIVSKQRNHILSHDIPLPDQFGDAASLPPISTPTQGAESAVSGYTQTASATVYNISSVAQDTESSQPSTNPLKTPSSLAVPDWHRQSGYDRTGKPYSLPSSPRRRQDSEDASQGDVSPPSRIMGPDPTPFPFLRMQKSQARAPATQPYRASPEWNLSMTTQHASEENCSSRNAHPQVPGSVITISSDDPTSRRRGESVDYRMSSWTNESHGNTRSLRTVSEVISIPSTSSKRHGSVPNTMPDNRSLLWISQDDDRRPEMGRSRLSRSFLSQSGYNRSDVDRSNRSECEEDTPTHQAWSAEPSSVNVTERSSARKPSDYHAVTEFGQKPWQDHKLVESISSSSSHSSSSSEKEQSRSSTMSISHQDVERGTQSKGCPVNYNLEESFSVSLVSDRGGPVSTCYYTDSMTNDKSSIFKISSGSDE
eukprot:Blabericola_migrator_1__10709@NODE_611_length_7289_cov_181_899889_g444_i0_p2_GENE_NODE_611_length_7289_cov_181_899889_g444_i0NODE_611_length_7289_cov_181_899889_g444_i0_p2_ORF_typecomplete_len986_score231_81DUF3584/PF12128_8/4_1e02DUF3584/PF12128_8/2_2e06MAD/PF05557_13/2_2e03MAD/PF05557_13/0_0015MAD/PF05557_13/0_0049ERM/PF00769_19/1_8e04ERM/PF00769_19/27ERM/PF00769_19/0_013ERM/PF00769_19/0_004ERM/PF00769_19/51ERM/PF00769_19/3_2e03BRE1/PF08647_11/4_2e03BRE1/PF08647_11/4_6e03BRE1/PF08647_11/34BRE1